MNLARYSFELLDSNSWEKPDSSRTKRNHKRKTCILGLVFLVKTNKLFVYMHEGGTNQSQN